ncbi:MAG TPA: hypothetical protein VK645_16680 [Chitinophagaceae bacterium]|nr:hypothetical protein [Chitinophagaceae bacterium]
MKKYILLAAAFMLFTELASSQGCIPVRSINGFGQYNLTDNAFSTSSWQLNITGRYFRSFRDFREKVDLKTPPQNESVNEVYTLDLSLNKMFRNGWSVNMSLPLTSNSRTSSIEHGGPNATRHATRTFGAGDLRFTVYKWLLLPAVEQKFNVQLGLGIKLPTGDYKYQDYFYRNDTTKVLSGVNPSIQLGDGGTGFITELNTFYIFNKTISLYGNFYYLISPREQNGTGYTMGKTPTAVQVASGSVETSVPDVYSIRAGMYINTGKLSFSAGIRDEGTPAYDLIGGSNGTRRAGYYLSVEPGILYKMKKITLYVYVPVVVDRKIKQNVPDKKTTEITHVYTVGPGGSANYELLAGISFKL